MRWEIFQVFHFSPFTVRQVLDTDGCSHASVFLTNESVKNSTTLYFQRGKENCILSKIPEKFLFKVTKLLFVLVEIYKTLGPWACLKSLFLEDPRNHLICQRLNVKCQKSNANIHPSIGFNCHNSPISVLINSLCIKSILGHFRSGKRKQSCSS